MEDITTIIRHHFPQFAEPKLQEEILQYGTLHSYSKGQVIMEYGSYVRFVPLVVHGSIKVMREGGDGGELLLYFLQAGDTCSMTFTCCMMEKQSSIRTVAEDDTTILAIPLKYADNWMNTYKSWRNFVMTAYDNRILDLVKTLDSVVFDKLDQRLLDHLKKKAEANHSTTIHTTHQEIANDLNASREAISRVLKHMEKLGKIQLGRNKISIQY